MFARLAARDLAIVGAAVLLWRLGAQFSAADGAFADFAGVVVGLLAGVCIFVLHEWGHLLGAFATGSTISAPRSLATPFLFSFDSRRNSRRQFLVMSFAGWAVTLACVWVAYALLPTGLFAARVARGVVMANALLVVVIEVPLVAFSLFTGRVPPVETQAAPRSPEPAAA